MEAKLQPNGDILLHYGVKGMRWGIRKQRKTKGRKRKTKEEDVKEKRFCKKATKQASDNVLPIRFLLSESLCTSVTIF